MKKSDLKAGTLYGYRRGDYGQVMPVILLDDSTLWTWNRKGGFGASDGTKIFRKSKDKRYVAQVSTFMRTDNGPHGFLVLSISVLGEDDEQRTRMDAAKSVAAELGVTPDEDAVNRLRGSLPKGVYLDIENNRWLLGEYEAAVKVVEEESNARHAQWRAESDEAQRQQRVVKAISEAFDERGLASFASRTGDHRVEVDLEALASLLGVEAE